MDMLFFCTIFIFQLVGHLVGDWLFQSNNDSINKTTSTEHLIRHCMMYTWVIMLFVAFIAPVEVTIAIAVLTFIEHCMIDTRKPVVGYKTFFERKFMKDNSFDIKNLPVFVIIGMDQSVHILRIFILSVLAAFYV